jgi:hypothetical protein
VPAYFNLAACTGGRGREGKLKLKQNVCFRDAANGLIVRVKSEPEFAIGVHSSIPSVSSVKEQMEHDDQEDGGEDRAGGGVVARLASVLKRGDGTPALSPALPLHPNSRVDLSSALET